MFTGLIQAVAPIASLDPKPFGLRLAVNRPRAGLPTDRPIQPGDSIAVCGVCLTVTDLTSDTLAFDVILETLDKTNLGKRAVGDLVNLETAVTAHQPLGGHFMQGHVDALGSMTKLVAGDEEYRLTIKPPVELLDYIIPKGSIALDGVSLTIASIDAETFDVALIPLTLERTTLGSVKVGDWLNLEADILAKTAVHRLRRQHLPHSEPITWQTLGNAGFVPAPVQPGSSESV